jgi:hypothetical protein
MEVQEEAMATLRNPTHVSLTLLMSLTIMCPHLFSQTSPRALSSEVVRSAYGNLPLSFEVNAGQTDSDVKFLARGAGYTVFLTQDEAVLALLSAPESASGDPSSQALRHVLEPGAPPPLPQTSAVLAMRLVGANPKTEASGADELPNKSNYFVGRDPRGWHSNIANFARVRYGGVYPGVDLVFYGKQGQLEYDFVVAPRASAGVVAFQFRGAERLRVDPNSGDLLVGVGLQEARFHRPVAYQVVPSAVDAGGGGTEIKQPINADYVLDAHNRVGFRLSAYDHSRPLIIDPTLSYSTYLGGSSDDYGTSLAVDSAGNAYITGYTNSVKFPTTIGVFQPQCSGSCSKGSDVFVTELNSTGTALVYSTYLGGSFADYGYGIAVNAAGDAFVTGVTFSEDFPVTKGSYQPVCGGGSCGGGDAFITELNPGGTALVYSTYLGGSTVNYANAIALDNSGNAYVTGWTQSTDFPTTPGVVQPTCSCMRYSDTFLTKLNSSGTALIYSTYLGGPSNDDYSYAVAVDSAENAYITGYTYSSDFPTTPGAFQTKLGAQVTGFVSKLNSTATQLSYSTFLGGTGTGSNPCATCLTGIVVDSAGDAFVSGLAWTTNFPTAAGVFQPNFAGGFHDAIVAELNPTGSGLIYASYLGGTGDDGATAIALDSSGNVYLRGNTFSVDFPVTPGAYQTSNAGGSDAWMASVNAGATKLTYSTYFGGSGNEYGVANRMIALDQSVPPNVYITGFTTSTNLPVTSGAFQSTNAGGNDVFVAKFAPSPNVGLSAPLNFGNQTVGTTSAAQTITLTNTGNESLTISSVTGTGSNARDFSQTNNCVGTVGPGSTCAVSVKFTPSASGTRNATVSITDSAVHSPHTLAITGIGVPTGSPAVSLSATALTFALQTVNSSSAPLNVTLSNVGTGTLNFTSISTSGNFSQSNTCGSSLAAGANCNIAITFTPLAANILNGTVTITDNAPGNPEAITLTGSGTYLTLSPATLNFGSVEVATTSANKKITVTNTGPSALPVDSLTIIGLDNQDYSQTNTCGSSIAAGKTCKVTVTFTPSVVGTRTGSVSVSVYELGVISQTVALTGSGSP